MLLHLGNLIVAFDEEKTIYNTLDILRNKKTPIEGKEQLLKNLLLVFNQKAIKNGNFSDFDFSGLDLRNVDLSEYKLSEREHYAIFTDALIGVNTFRKNAHTKSVTCIDVSSNGANVLSCGKDKVILWDFGTRSIKNVLYNYEVALGAYSNSNDQVMFDFTGKYAVFTDGSKVIEVEIDNGNPIEYLGATHPIISLFLSKTKSGDTLYFGKDESRNLYVWKKGNSSYRKIESKPNQVMIPLLQNDSLVTIYNQETKCTVSICDYELKPLLKYIELSFSLPENAKKLKKYPKHPANENNKNKSSQLPTNENIQTEFTKEEVQVVELFDENGESLVFELLSEMGYEGNNYVVLTPFIEDESQIDAEVPAEVFVMQKVVRENKGEMLDPISDTALVEKIFDTFRSETKDKFDFADTDTEIVAKNEGDKQKRENFLNNENRTLENYQFNDSIETKDKIEKEFKITYSISEKNIVIGLQGCCDVYIVPLDFVSESQKISLNNSVENVSISSNGLYLFIQENIENKYCFHIYHRKSKDEPFAKLAKSHISTREIGSAKLVMSNNSIFYANNHGQIIVDLVSYEAKDKYYIYTSLDNHSPLVEDIALKKEGQCFVAYEDGIIREWNYLSGNKIREFSREHTAPIRAITVAHSSDLLVSGGEDGKLLLWDIEEGTTNPKVLRQIGDFLQLISTEEKQLDSTAHFIRDVVISDDDKYIIASCNHGLISVWQMNNTETGPLMIVNSGQGVVKSIIYFRANSEHRLVSGGFNGSLIFWNLDFDNNKIVPIPELSFLNAHSDRVRSLALAPDKSKFVSYGEDNKIIEWSINGDKLSEIDVNFSRTTIDEDGEEETEQNSSCYAESICYNGNSRIRKLTAHDKRCKYLKISIIKVKLFCYIVEY